MRLSAIHNPDTLMDYMVGYLMESGEEPQVAGVDRTGIPFLAWVDTLDNQDILAYMAMPTENDEPLAPIEFPITIITVG